MPETKSIPADYASVTISIDHLLNEPHNGHTVLKVIFSTETATEALAAQADYFGLTSYMVRPGILRLLSAAMDTAAVLVIRAKENLTNVIVDNAILSELLDPDSELGAKLNPEGTLAGAHGALIQLAMDLIRSNAQQGDPRDRITGWLSEADPVEPVEEAA